jgi:hypothetical protein
VTSGSAALHDRLAEVVERAGRLVQQQNGRRGDERTRDHDALSLTAGKCRAALGDEGLVAHGHVFDVVVDGSALSGVDDFAERYAIGAERDILANAAGHQERLLQDDSHAPPERLQIEAGDVSTIEEDAPHGRQVQAQEQTAQRRFAGTGGSDQRHLLTLLDP